MIARASMLCAGLAGALAITAPLARAQEPAPLEVPERLARGVYRIESLDARGQVMRGSAVLVAPHILVTNCHVVREAQDIAVTSPVLRQPARLVRGHATRDLCLLAVPALDAAPVALGSTASKAPGDAIIAVGYPGGAALRASAGRIEGLYRHDGAGRVVQGSAAFGAGKSGGALFDESGKLIGILTFKARAGGPFHFAVPVEWVAALLEDSAAALAPAAKPFWRMPREQQPAYLRAASLAAQGDCDGLTRVTTDWLTREPGNPEALWLVERARSCGQADGPPRTLLERWLAALRG